VQSALIFVALVGFFVTFCLISVGTAWPHLVADVIADAFVSVEL